ncbi:hypothetical protein [Serratia marcescens]|uniref:hypothetical protein n=1 Tax=Serratia marcescens TaxID=615 RepID=UPI0034ACDF49
MTLTTERLKWLHDAATELSATKLKMTMRPDELLVLTSELLANREARPVYQYRMRNPYNGQVTDWETIKPEQVDFILKETIAANVEFRIIAAPPAPAVPPEASPDDIPQEHNINTYSGITWAASWNACRAAMLAQSVSRGYKFVPVEPTEDMIAAAMNCDDVTFTNPETFCVNFGNIYAAMLAAAPEGRSND